MLFNLSSTLLRSAPVVPAAPRRRSAPFAPTGPTPPPRIGWSGWARYRFSAASPRPPTPPASQARHFTTLDQVTQLVGVRDADPDLGFMARLLALCSLPRTNPKNRHEFKRVNGPYTLYMVAGGGNKLP